MKGRYLFTLNYVMCFPILINLFKVNQDVSASLLLGLRVCITSEVSKIFLRGMVNAHILENVVSHCTTTTVLNNPILSGTLDRISLLLYSLEGHAETSAEGTENCF